MGLPTDDKGRKALPIFRGPLMYFPDALLAIAAVCKAGNDQHNPGQPMHWAREKSTEQLDTALRHMMDHGLGNERDVDGTWHLAKAAWRLLAELQLAIERERGMQECVARQSEHNAKQGDHGHRAARVARHMEAKDRASEDVCPRCNGVGPCELCGHDGGGMPPGMLL